MYEFLRSRKSLLRGALVVAVVAALAMAGGVAASAHPQDHPRPVDPNGLAVLPALTPVMDCSAVTGLDLSHATDAPVTITSAMLVTANTAAPYCEVRGTIAPANTIVLRLPTEGWTQRYVQTGCGGECGSSNINFGQAANCPPVVAGQVAVATTDMGHQGQNDGSWAADNPQAQIDFAYRGVPVTSQVAKAIIGKFYRHRPAYSYFTGCSDGGREALMEDRAGSGHVPAAGASRREQLQGLRSGQRQAADHMSQ